jgi:hypothetical protein
MAMTKLLWIDDNTWEGLIIKPKQKNTIISVIALKGSKAVSKPLEEMLLLL